MSVALSLSSITGSAMEAPAAEIRIERVSRRPAVEDFAGMDPPPEIRLASVSRFTQREPSDGAPPSQETTVWIGYDAAELFVVFVCFDSEPRKIRSQLTSRDTITDDDFVTIQLDTFRDRKRAYVFGANPFGVQLDAIWVEGRGFDYTFDTVFHSQALRTSRGYVVLLRIPFASLRFPPADEQRWGVLLTRDVPRGSEEVFWPAYTKAVEGRLNQMGTLAGLRGISPPETFQFIPYSSAAAERGSSSVSSGLDAKAVIHDSLVFDVTVNPDFSQVASDDPQLTANQRFELLFPEKRPFFLENASYFATPLSLVFTRRLVDPRAGLRLTGKRGSWGIGTMIVEDSHDASQNTVARVTRDIGRESFIGVLLTTRRSDAERNSLLAIDSRVKLSRNRVLEVQAAASDMNGWRDHAFLAVLTESGPRTTAIVRLTDIGEDFRSALGFVPRTNLRRVDTELYHYSYRNGKYLTSIEPINFTEADWDQDGRLLDWVFSNGVQWNFIRRSSARLYYEVGSDRLRPGSFPSLDRDQDERWWAAGFVTQNSLWRAATVVFNGRFGRQTNFFPAPGKPPQSEKFTQWRLAGTFRPTSQLSHDLTVIDLRQQSFHSTVAQSRWNYQATRRFAVRVIVQYDRLRTDRSQTSVDGHRDLHKDITLSYGVNPGTAIFVGYKSNTREVAPDGNEDGSPATNHRGVFAKISYLIRR